MSTQYTNSLDYLLDELQIIFLLIVNRVQNFSEPIQDENPLHGLAISNERISKIMHELKSDNTESNIKIKEKISEFQETIAKKNPSSENIPLQKLIHTLNLTEFEKRIILLCLAPEINSSYGILYAFLQDNVAKKKPSSNLILDILCESSEEKIHCKKYLSENSKLHKFGILEFEHSEILDTSLKINSKTVEFLLEITNNDSTEKGLKLSIFKESEPTIFRNEQVEIEKSLQHTNFTKILLQGIDVIEKQIFAENLISKLKIPMLYVDLKKLFDDSASNDPQILNIYRNLAFHSPSVYIHNLSSISLHPLKTEIKQVIENIQTLMQSISEQKTPSILFLDIDEKIDSEIIDVDEYCKLVRIPKLNYVNRKNIWQLYLKDKVPIETIKDLANKFKLNSLQIKNAFNLANKNIHSENKFSIETLYDACKQQYNGQISDIAKIIVSKYKLDDIILESQKKDELQEIIDFANNQNLIFDEMGFKKTIENSDKLNILLSGPPGVGKTMIASIIANELKLDLMKIDLSQIMSKFVGETEKNIDRVFQDALTNNGILFFDEADALLGKRVEANNNMDKFGNMQLLHLTQKIERHEGIVIFATNLPKTLDQSIPRRMDKWMEIPFPAKDQRYQLWKNVFPSECEVNLNEDDYLMLANNFMLTGAHIKNIAVSSAFHAVRNNTKINLENILFSIKQEYVKMNKSPTRSEFGKYYYILET